MAKRYHESFFWRAYRRVDVPMPWRTWEQMPRHPAFKNEYWDGEAHYTPRPRTTPAVLHFERARLPDPGKVGWRQHPRQGRLPTIRPIAMADWDALAPVLVASMPQDPPFGQWRGGAGVRAARQALRECRDGREGPLIAGACLLAEFDAGFGPADRFAAAIVVTETQRPGDYSIEPHECVVRDARQVAAHLTFVFTSWTAQRHGLATRLLAASVAELRTLGFGALATNVLLSPEHSVLWHWRNGFEVGSHYVRVDDSEPPK